VKTVAYKDKGIDELMEAIEKHRQFLGESGRLDKMLRERGRRQLLATAQAIMMERVVKAADASIEELAGQIAAREIDPRTAAEQLIAGSG
jgi:LAO/AO transport system kinase